MKTNYHTHTSYCRHAEGCAEDYVIAAIARGIQVLGFSDHGPFPDLDPGLRMSYPELPDYLRDVAAAKQQHAGEISLYAGLEIEYLPSQDSYYKSLLTERGLDYLILGEHFCETPDGYLNIYTAESTEDYLLYANGIAEGIASGYFRIVAHPDLMLLNPFPWDSNCDTATRLIVDMALRHGCALEFNANGYRRGLSDFPDGRRYPYPDPRFWEYAASAGAEVVVNADAHQPAHVWDDAMDLAWETARKLSLNLITEIGLS